MTRDTVDLMEELGWDRTEWMSMTRAQKIKALMDELGLTRSEAIAELKDMGEI